VPTAIPAFGGYHQVREESRAVGSGEVESLPPPLLHLQRLKILNCWKYGLDVTFLDFWNFIDVEFGLGPKTLFDPYVLFSHKKST
jgi:hypothetical protein